MDILYWLLIFAMFIIAFIGLVYPIIPSVVFIIAGFILYGFLFSFEPFTYLFWMVEGIFIVALLVADHLANLFGVKRFGGSRAAIWGSTIGLLVGPFIIPIVGIIVGPFIGAMLGELLIHKKDIKTAVKIGTGSLLGFISGVLAKSVIQVIMIGYFLFAVL
ncbi:DUF456 domain-containing protein [Bacillus sp. CLL-7-23]|uniref:DUF456 domain-containing protein n=1 Tax=Bacillus changyiensis TaxID=3004103 RepID=A0ABT4X6A2_9BACI|nr:DUF456 domain-containing protein [Bacillus changyiensis]MDA7026931.1 DUF456 domain-containing protein [Bacillus changyiensis]